MKFDKPSVIEPSTETFYFGARCNYFQVSTLKMITESKRLKDLYYLRAKLISLYNERTSKCDIDDNFAVLQEDIFLKFDTSDLLFAMKNQQGAIEYCLLIHA